MKYVVTGERPGGATGVVLIWCGGVCFFVERWVGVFGCVTRIGRSGGGGFGVCYAGYWFLGVAVLGLGMVWVGAGYVVVRD